jgi:catechol 2,3-dioxygenase-like lactoylglutathione lyase family enzyme
MRSGIKMKQHNRSQFRRTFVKRKFNFKKSFWIGLGIVFSLTILLVTSTQQLSALAQNQTQAKHARFELHHVTLSASNADRLSKWYVQMLGFTIRDRFTLARPTGEKIQVVRVEIPGLKMNISQFDNSISPARVGEHQGWRHLALQVDNVDRNYQQLEAKGVQFMAKPFTYNSSGFRIAFFRDPEGNILELYQDL